MIPQFEIESIFKPTTQESIYVFAKLLNNYPFTLSDNSKLGDISIENWVDVPRAIDKEGNQRTDLFVFVLKNSSDKEYFSPQQVVELIQ
jgi:hypothetical protein